MNPENWNQAKEIFYSALHKLPEEREIFLAEVCGDDYQLLSDVKILIKSYQSEFLEEPLFNFHSESSADQILPEAKFRAGDRINHYIIRQSLGRGGMGEVYLADDTKLDRLVAVKILHQGAGDKAEQRLRREARAAAGLDHPNICSIYEIGETSEFTFIVMQYIEGFSLHELIKNKSISVSESLAVARQIAHALEEAHSHHLVHRDIKPSNIIIDTRRQVKVLDFGLAKKIAEAAGENSQSVLSEAGVVAGTVAYMSPEQVRGQVIDARSDVWSLGVLLYEMLTGKLPFAGESKNDVIASILTAKQLNLSANDAKFPPRFDEVIGKALQKNRNERYSSIGEFSQDLAELSKLLRKSPDAAGETGENNNPISGTARETLITDRFSADSDGAAMTAQSNRKIFFPLFQNFRLIPVYLLLILFVSFVLWQFFPKNVPKTNAFSPDSRERLQISTLFSIKRKPQGKITDLSFSPDGKLIVFLLAGEGVSDVYIKQTDSGEPVKLTDGKQLNQTPVWSPDGQRIAFVSERDGILGIWSVSYLGGIPVLQTPLKLNRLDYQLKKWSRDGRRIYFETNEKLHTIELDSGQISDIKLPDIEVFGSFAVSADEKMISYVVIENEKEKIWAQSLETGEAKAVSQNDHANWSPVFFPDDRRIAYSSNQNGNFQIYVSNLSGTENMQVTFGDSNANVPAISPDGKKLIYVSELDEANIFSFDLQKRSEMRQTSNTKMQLFPSIAPDNTKMVFQVTDDNSKIYASPIKLKILGEQNEATQISQFGGWAKWSPLGDRIAFLKFSGAKLNLWTLTVADQKEKPLTDAKISMGETSSSPYNLLDTPYNWSPDGRKIVSTLIAEDTFNVWTSNADGSDFRVVTTNRDDQLMYLSPVWSPDGNAIAFLERKMTDSKTAQFSVLLLSNGRVENLFQINSRIRLLGFSKTGSEIYIAVRNQNDTDLLAVAPNAAPKFLTKLKEAYFAGIVFSPDAKEIAFAARRGGLDNIFLHRIRAAAPDAPVTANLENTLYYSGIAWSPDGNSLFYSKQSGGMQISMIDDKK